MTADKYFDMCEQLGKEPKVEDIPIDLNDFPNIVHDAMVIFNSLNDKVLPDIGYLGKDFTNLNILIETFKIEDKELLLELLIWMDKQAIKKSSEDMKKAREKAKRKSNGK